MSLARATFPLAVLATKQDHASIWCVKLLQAISAMHPLSDLFLTCLMPVVLEFAPPLCSASFSLGLFFASCIQCCILRNSSVCLKEKEKSFHPNSSGVASRAPLQSLPLLLLPWLVRTHFSHLILACGSSSSLVQGSTRFSMNRSPGPSQPRLGHMRSTHFSLPFSSTIFPLAATCIQFGSPCPI